MVQEVRKISLSMKELPIVLASYRQIAPKFMPAGDIVSCNTSGTDKVVVEIDVIVGSATQKTTVNIQRVDLLKPLMRFCPENNIMLPRAGNKSITIEDGLVTLLIEMKHQL